MKLSRTIFLLLLFSLLGGLARADEQSWQAPADKTFHNIPVSDRILPLGFSKHAIFAYLLQQNSCHDSASAKRIVSLVVVNLISDKVLVDKVLGSEPAEIEAGEVLSRYDEAIQEMMTIYKIQTSQQYEILTDKAINTKETSFTVQLKLTEDVPGEDAPNPGYQIYQVQLNSSKKGSKVLGEIKTIYEPALYWGHLKSPFEDRVVLFILSDFRGCDAEPQMRINVMGGSLVYGFKSSRL